MTLFVSYGKSTFTRTGHWSFVVFSQKLSKLFCIKRAANNHITPNAATPSSNVIHGLALCKSNNGYSHTNWHFQSWRFAIEIIFTAENIKTMSYQNLWNRSYFLRDIRKNMRHCFGKISCIIVLQKQSIIKLGSIILTTKSIIQHCIDFEYKNKSRKSFYGLSSLLYVETSECNIL